MALVLNEEQVMLRDAARDFLQAKAPVDHLRSLRDTGNSDGLSTELWTEIVEMGWAAVVVPEEHGGLGYGFTGIGLILEECGRTLTPSPLLSSSMVAAAMIARSGSEEQKAAYLPGLAGGDHLMALAVDEGTHHDPEVCSTVASKLGDGYQINGNKVAVVDGGVADTFIVAARTSDESMGLFLVPANSAGVEVLSISHLDTHKAAMIRLTDVELPVGAELASHDGLDTLLDIARIGQCAELLGIAQEVFERTMSYLRDRKQFGVQIGVFQGLAHRAAHLYTEIELCKSVVLNALQVLDSGADDFAETASMAKAKLSEIAHLAATEGVQMHGGMGMTDECEIGFFLKRCRIVETLYGDRYFHLDRYARLKGF
jgi:alkylation response protein AidB-like acyl-CoA dehydrogenase